jgi:excisionase family DNA binding protein
MNEHSIERQLSEIKNHIAQQAISQKEILTLSEAAIFAGISKSYLYKMTSERRIPYYRPESKLIYFKRSELENWLLKNRKPTKTELSSINLPSKKQII